MKRQLVSLGIVFFWLASSIMAQVPSVSAQNWQELSPDIDGDGLPNDLETAGWYNEAGGPFFTNPFDADSDDDGLTDGEEKLYDTIPINGPGDLNGAKSPGIYVEYNDNFHTKEYFRATDPAYLSVKQAGDRYLMTEAMVVRRGTTFRIGGPSNATLTVSGDGLTEPSVQKDPCQGGWIVSLPPNGTVGTYTATVSLDGWQKAMPIHVIFELPTPTEPSLPLTATLTQEGIEAFLYNDDPADRRDETAIIWYVLPPYKYSRRCDAGYPPPCYDADDFYHTTRGWSEAFFTEHYKKYIFVDKVMWRIHGQTSQALAVDALSDGADEEVRVNYSNFGQGPTGQPLSYQISYVLYRAPGPECPQGETQTGTACHAQAGTFTSFLRAAGIPARPFITDWWNSQYDTSVLAWFDGEWWAARSYNGQEISGSRNRPCYPFEAGHTYQRHLRDWDLYGSYRENASHLLTTANEGWDWEMVNTGRVYDEISYENERRTREYKWDSIAPLEMEEKHPYIDTLNSIVWKGEPWLPTGWPDAYRLPNPYPGGDLNENWPIEPIPQACPAGFTGNCPYPPLGGLGALGTPSGARGQPALGAQPPLQARSDRVRLGPVVKDYGIDTDGNARFNKLIVEVEVTAFQPGNYTIGGTLFLGGAGTIYADNIRVYLHEGMQIVQLPFDGLAIGRNKENGPYQVTELWITDVEDFDPRLGPWEKALDYQHPDYITAPYTADQFETLGASLADGYGHRGLDNDGDGRFEAVAVDVALDIFLPGTYRVEGDLYDGKGNFVGHATWTGTGSVASLQFELEKTTPPYKLENLQLFDFIGALLDVRSQEAYTITDLGSWVDQGAVTMDLYLPPSGGIGPLGLTITPTHVFSDTVVDLDGDGKYDQLVLGVQVDVSEADQYRVEGWLEGPDGSLIVYALSNPTALETGLQTISLTFDGRAINGRGVNGPYTVIALRILDGTDYDVLDEMQETGLALDYDAADFEPATDTPFIFNDNMENGTGNWNWNNPPWSLDSNEWHSSSHAWKADASGSQNGSLTTTTLHLSHYANPRLRLKTCYNMQSAGDLGYLEASANGGAWTRVVTYTNSTYHWDTGLVDLSDFENIPNLRLRFKASSQSQLHWYIDDVSLNAEPDADNDGLSDEDEDLNHNGNPDDDDTDHDGVPDYLEPNNTDTDGDGLMDYQDPDDDGDGILTANEDVNHDGNRTNDDTDHDGVPNYLDRDDDGDGVYTAYEGADPNHDGDPADAQDSDHDGVPDYLDRDDDGDGVYTDYEGADPNHDGNPADARDSDNDGLKDYLDSDDDGDGVPTADERPDPNGDGNPADAWDTDGYYTPGTPDYLDPDDDGDGIPTANESAEDPDGDGVPDYLDPSNNASVDDDGDGVPTANEDWDHDGDPTNDDRDGDSIPDYMDPDVGTGIYLPIILK